MYGGQVVETAPSNSVFHNPRHPYSKALLDTMPQSHSGDGDLPVIAGLVPAASAWPAGCRFAPRCQFATETCHTDQPPLEPIGDDLVRCLRHDEVELCEGERVAVSAEPDDVEVVRH